MKKLLLIGAISSTFFAHSQVTVFQDSFDTYNDFIITGIGAWSTLDLDQLNTYTGGQEPGATPWTNAGAKQAYMVFNPTTALVSNSDGLCDSAAGTELRNFDPRTGVKYASCWGGVPAAGVTANNDWLISPSINLTGATGPNLSFWVKSLSSCYGLEKYRVGVYTGTGNPTLASDFTIISGGTDLTAPNGTWQERTLSLGSYIGQSIRIGIQCKSADVYMFMVDDFKVTATTLSSNSFDLTNNIKIYPNPAKDILNIDRAGLDLTSVNIADLNGRTVKEVKNNVEAISIADLSSGIYMVTINTENGKKVEKLIVE